MKKNNTPPAENQDFIGSFLESVIRYCKTHKKGVITALSILLVAAVLGSCYSSYTQKITQNSWAAYYNAQLALLTQGEEAAFKQIDQLAKDYSGTNAAEYAQLSKADLLYANENFAQAADVYKNLLDANNTAVREIATLSLGATQQASKDYKSSADLMNTFIKDNPKSFALPQAYFTLAYSEELAGNKEAAVNAYKHLLEAYTKTYFGTAAKDRLDQIEK